MEMKLQAGCLTVEIACYPVIKIARLVSAGDHPGLKFLEVSEALVQKPGVKIRSGTLF